jgi:hypothetical protein
VNRIIPFSAYRDLAAPRARGLNVFWSGERFMLLAEAAGDPSRVVCQIRGHASYQTDMRDTGGKNAAGERIYDGSIWDSSMINKWGRSAPEELTFIFTAYYSGGDVKTHEVTVILDTREDYWQLHRYY